MECTSAKLFFVNTSGNCQKTKVEKAIQNDLIRSRQALIVDHKNSDESNASEPQSEQKINSSSCQNKSEDNGVNGSGVDINGVPSIANGKIYCQELPFSHFGHNASVPYSPTFFIFIIFCQ